MGTFSIVVANHLSLVWLLVTLPLVAFADPLSTSAAVRSPSTGRMLLGHGTLVISSIHLLDVPVRTSTQQLLDEAAAASNITQRCCLSIKVYSTALQQSSSSAQHAPLAPASMIPSAAFCTCTSSLQAGCIESLLQGTHSNSAYRTYKVTLLLPARTAALSNAPQQPEDPVPDASKHQADMQDKSSRLDSESDVIPTPGGARSSDTPAAAVQPIPSGSAQHSSRQGMLLTVHVEQEVTGQVHLAELIQYVPAGTGVVRLAVNMSHYSHTWTHPDILLASLAHSNTAPTADVATEPAATALEIPADTATFALDAHAAASTDEVSICPPIPEPDCAAEVLEVHAMHAASANTTTATQHVPEGVPALLPAQVTSDPAVLAYVLQTALGHENTKEVWHVPQFIQSPPLQQQQARGPSAHSKTDHCADCRCPILPDAADLDAVESWAAAVQAEVLSCKYDASFSRYLESAAAAAALAQYSKAASHSAEGLLASIAALPAVAPVLDRIHALLGALPIVSSASPEHLLLGLLAAGVSSSLLLATALLQLCLLGLRKESGPQPAAAAQQQQTVRQQEAQQDQQQGHRAALAPPNAARDNVLHRQDQYTSLEDHMQDMDDDIFGYGAAPAPAYAAAAATGVHPQGGLLAASYGFRRASAMAVTEAAGALKDAFMRRHTNQVSAPAGGLRMEPTAVAAAGGSMLAAGADRDWLNEEDEDRVNQAPASIQRQLAAGGRWTRDGEGRLVRGSWKGVRNSLSAAATAVVAAVGTGGRAAAAAAAAAVASGRNSLRGAGAATGEAAGAQGGMMRGWGEGDSPEDAAALQQLLSAAPGAVVSFDRS